MPGSLPEKTAGLPDFSASPRPGDKRDADPIRVARSPVCLLPRGGPGVQLLARKLLLCLRRAETPDAAPGHERPELAAGHCQHFPRCGLRG